ncbi:hypothetical protein [Ochrobactrum sp. A-1]|uniref:hypothetical protein n=1 Tax=Ochrobactrum sp. A-1 TaxID=2920940 RepID=UPI001F0A0A92|nr:hypothetical protein [Ochrobactrum sp. A-1]
MLSFKDKNMLQCDTVEAQRMMRDAFPTRRTGSVKASIYQAYRALKPLLIKDFTPRRARSIWEGAARRIDGEEMNALRQLKIMEARREREEVSERLAQLDAALALLDQATASGSLAA